VPKIVDVDQRRSELTEAAARVIARSGIEAATVREVAAEAGWTTGALTHYFADKRELLLLTFQASLSHRRSLRPEQASSPPNQRLRAALEGALALDEQRRRHWLVTIACCSQAAGDPEFAIAQRDAYREFRAYVSGLIGGIQGTTDDALAERLIAVADGIAVQALFDPGGWPAERQLEQLERLLGSTAPALPI
jgi:AcrR family transcriptional regulator